MCHLRKNGERELHSLESCRIDSSEWWITSFIKSLYQSLSYKLRLPTVLPIGCPNFTSPQTKRSCFAMGTPSTLWSRGAPMRGHSTTTSSNSQQEIPTCRSRSGGPRLSGCGSTATNYVIGAHSCQSTPMQRHKYN